MSYRHNFLVLHIMLNPSVKSHDSMSNVLGVLAQTSPKESVTNSLIINIVYSKQISQEQMSLSV